MAITREVVVQVAKLAQLELSADEVDGMVRDLGRILGYVEELSTVDTTDVAPTTSVAVREALLRTDARLAGTDRAAALAEAPRSAEGGFAVPGFVDE